MTEGGFITFLVVLLFIVIIAVVIGCDSSCFLRIGSGSSDCR